MNVNCQYLDIKHLKEKFQLRFVQWRFCIRLQKVNRRIEFLDDEKRTGFLPSFSSDRRETLKKDKSYLSKIFHRKHSLKSLKLSQIDNISFTIFIQKLNYSVFKNIQASNISIVKL